MAFQFKRDRGDNITLLLAGDIDLEVTQRLSPSFPVSWMMQLRYN